MHTTVAVLATLLLLSSPATCAPSAPTAVTLLSSSATTLRISWANPPPSTPPLTSLEISADPVPPPPGSPPPPPLRLVTLTVTPPTLPTSTTITGLAPGTEYAVSLVAVDDQSGRSPPSSPLLLASTSPSAPMPPTAVSLDPLNPPSSRAFHIVWSPPSDTGTAASAPLAVDGYQIAYSPTNGPAAGADVLALSLGSAAAASVTVSVLPGTRYSVTVATLNSAGLLSEPSAPALLLDTPPGLPDPPKAVSPGPYTLVPPPPLSPLLPYSVSVSLAWSPPLATGAAHLAIVGYNVSLTRTTGPAAPYAPTALVLPSAAPWSLPGLAPGSGYTAVLMSTNELGVSSAPSAPVSLATPYAPPSRVQALAGGPVGPGPAGQTALTVTWASPASTGGWDIGLANITVSVAAAAAASPGSPPLASLVLAPGASSAPVSGLAPGTAYTVSVFATNTVGLAGDVASVDLATSPGVPQAPQELTLSSVGETHVAVAWPVQSPAELGGPVTALSSVTLTVSPAGSLHLPLSAVSLSPDGTTLTASTLGSSLLLEGSTSYSVSLSVTNTANLTSPSSAPRSATTLAWGSDSRVAVLSSPVALSEAAGSGAGVPFGVVLAAPPEPGSTVSVPLSVPSGLASLSTAAVSFAASAWDVPVTVTAFPAVSPVAERDASGTSPVLLDLAVGPVAVAGGSPSHPLTRFYQGYHGALAAAFAYADADSIGVNVTVTVASDVSLRVSVSLTSEPKGAVSLLLAEELAGLVAAPLPASSLALPAQLELVLSADGAASLADSLSLDLGTTSSTADPLYNGLAVSAPLSGVGGPLVAYPAAPSPPPESLWDSLLGLWVVLIVLAVLLALIGVFAVVLRVLRSSPANRGAKRGSASVSPSPAASYNDLSAALASSDAVRIDPSVPDSSHMPRRSVLSAGSPRQGPSPASSPAAPRHSGSARPGAVSPPVLAPVFSPGAVSPPVHARAGDMMATPVMATPVARGISPASPGPAARRTDIITATQALYVSGDESGLARRARSPYGPGADATAMSDSTFLSERSSMAIGVAGGPSSARRRPLALPPVHKSTPIPFLGDARTPARRPRAAASPVAGADPETPIPYLIHKPAAASGAKAAAPPGHGRPNFSSSSQLESSDGLLASDVDSMSA